MNATTATCDLPDNVLADIIEAGNGYPRVGHYVATDDGDLYRVVSEGSRISTGHPTGDVCHNYRLAPADWDDCEDVFQCHVELRDAG